MRKKILIILNYQREIPPFIINEIKVLKDFFDEIIYITPYLKNDNSNAINFPNVTVIKGYRYESIKHLIHLPILLFSKEVLRELKKAIEWNRISKKFIKSFFQFLVASNYLFYKGKNIIDKNKKSEIHLLAAWMYSEAYAAARLKKLYDGLYVTSLAHSYEVNPLRDRNVDLHMNEYIHYHLNNINFISKEVYNNYYNYVMKKYKLKEDNITCIHLGTEKWRGNLARKSTDGCFRILSCSTMLPNKRLDRIITTILKWDKGDLIWTHIGNGREYDRIKAMAELTMEKNPLVKIKLIGYKDNHEVHAFYNQNTIDLFINVSEIEGVPVSLMECMSYGVPAVVTDVGGNTEIVKSNNNGFVIPSNFTDDELINTLIYYKNMTDEDKSIYRTNSFIQWSDNFDAKKNIQKRFRNIVEVGK